MGRTSNINKTPVVTSRLHKSFTRRKMVSFPRPSTCEGKWEPVLDQMVKDGVINSWNYMTLDGNYHPFVKVKFPGKGKEVITHVAAFYLLFQLMDKLKIHRYPSWLSSEEAKAMRKEIEEMENEKDYFQKLRYEFLRSLFDMGGVAT